MIGLGLSVPEVAVRRKAAGNVLANPDFVGDFAWTKGAGWAIAGGQASRTSTGTASPLTQAYAFTPGKSYEVTVVIAALTSGSILFRFAGGTNVSGTARAAAGTYQQTVAAVAGNNTFSLIPSTTWAGAIESVSVVELT